MTPIRRNLSERSALLHGVRDGLGALVPAHRDHLDGKIRPAFADSLDLDATLREKFPQTNRWDYLLGHSQTGAIVGLEPHPATSDQVSTVIAKRKASLEQLKPHLRAGARVSAWFWVASGRTQFSPMEKAVFNLQQNGITFVGGSLQQKHLASLEPVASGEAGGRRGRSKQK